MIKQRRGKIINISSDAAVLAPMGHAAYSASKGGLNLLTQQVWGEANKAEPMKARIPAGRFGEPSEVADLVLFLSSNASNFICGQVIRLDGGLTAV